MIGDTNSIGEVVQILSPVYNTNFQPTQYWSATRCGNVVHLSGAVNIKAQGYNLEAINIGLPRCLDFSIGFILDQNDNFKPIGYVSPIDSGGMLYSVTQTTTSGLMDLVYFTR